MSHLDSDEDFLDKIYAQSAKEQPPAELDKQILELAKNQVLHKPPASFQHWQRLASLAAVMVLSVYLFFDVRHERQHLLEEAWHPAHRSALEHAPSSPEAASPELSEAESKGAPQKALKQKQATSDAYPAMESSNMDAFTDAMPKVMEQTEHKRSLRMQSQPDAAEALFETEQIKPSDAAESMLREITLLLAAGKQEDAKTLYLDFKQRFPDYPVADQITQVLGVPADVPPRNGD